MEQGWIKLHRKVVDWEWYKDANTVRLFFHLLLVVNYTSKKWKGVEVKEGEIITSYGHLARDLGIGIQSIRTSIKRLKLTGNLTIKTNNKFVIISVLNWKAYQNQQANQQATNRQLTTTKERKKEKNNIPAKAGVKMKYKENTINYETGEPILQEDKPKKNKEAIRLAIMFDEMATEFLKQPIITPKSYFIVMNAMNTHNMTPTGIEKLYYDWFYGKNKKENKGKLSFALSANNINEFKVKHG